MVTPHLPCPSLSLAQSLSRGCPLDSLLDEQLLGLTQMGHAQAFDVLMTRHAAYFLTVAGRFVDEHTAQDVVQVAFMNIFRKIDTFQPGSHFKGWAYRIVTNCALMHLRKQRTRREVYYDSAQNHEYLPHVSPTASFPHLAPTPPVAQDAQIQRRELGTQIAQAIEALEPKYRSVFILREDYGMSLIEIAQELSLSVPAVKSRLHRARHFLRVSLAPHLGLAV